jgi:hypothetical protein
MGMARGKMKNPDQQRGSCPQKTSARSVTPESSTNDDEGDRDVDDDGDKWPPLCWVCYIQDLTKSRDNPARLVSHPLVMRKLTVSHPVVLLVLPAAQPGWIPPQRLTAKSVRHLPSLSVPGPSTSCNPTRSSSSWLCE